MNIFIARDGTVCKDAKEVEEHNRKREREAKTGVVYIDYRFIVKAKNAIEASEKVAKFLSEAIKGIWYIQTRSSYRK